MSKLIVFGSSGFVGRNILDYFLNDRNVESIHGVARTIPVSARLEAPNSSRLSFTMMDLRDSHAGEIELVIGDADVIIISAAYSSGANEILTDPLVHYFQNYKINLNLAEALTKLSTPRLVVFMSSSVVYPDIPFEVCEQSVTGEFSAAYRYVGEMKLHSEAILRASCERRAHRLVVIRPSNLYGTYDKRDPRVAKVIPATFQKTLTAGPIRMWGSGDSRRDFLHIIDFMKALSRLVAHPPKENEIFNLSSGRAVTMRDLANMIVNSVGQSGREIIFDNSDRDTIRVRRVCSRRFMDQYGWSPTYNLLEGIDESKGWYTDGRF